MGKKLKLQKLPEVLTFDAHKPLKGKKKFEDLNEKDIKEYFKKIVGPLAFIENVVIKPSELSLKSLSVYSDDNIPDDEDEIKKELDGIKFIITTTPTTKTPRYKKIYYDFLDYLKFLKSEYEKKARPAGVLTFWIDSDGEKIIKPFVSVEKLIDVLNGWKEQEVFRKAGVNQKIDYEIPEDMKKPIKRIVLSLRNYGDITNTGNAETYVSSDLFLDNEYEGLVTPVQNLIKLKTGFSKDNIPKETQTDYFNIGDYLFAVSSIPGERESYGKIIDDLLYLTSSRKITKKTGDFILLAGGEESPRLDKYEIRERNGKKYVSIGSLQNRTFDLWTKHRNRNLTQTISYLPIV